MSDLALSGKSKAKTWTSQMGIVVRSPSLLGRRQSATQLEEQDIPLSKTLSRDTTASTSSPPASDSTSLKSDPKWASKLKRTSSIISLLRPTAASAAKERDSDTASIQTTDSWGSTTASSRPGTPSTDPNGKGPKWMSKLGAVARRSPSVLSLARPTATSAAKETDAAPTPAHKLEFIPPAPGTASPAEASSAGAKPKTKWTSRVSGAMRRSSSLLSIARPVTAAKEDAVPPAWAYAYKAEVAAPVVVRAPFALTHEVDVLAESPTEEMGVPDAPLDASADVLIIDQVRASRSADKAAAAVDDTPELRTPEPFAHETDAAKRMASPISGGVSQKLGESSIYIKDAEPKRFISPFADKALPDLPAPAAAPVESNTSAHEHIVSPFANADSSEYAGEAPAEPLVVEAVAHERPTGPFADAALSDHVEEPKAVILPAEDLPPVVDVHVVEPAAQLDQERATSPFDNAALAPAILPDPAFTADQVEEPLSGSAHISTQSDKAGTEQLVLSAYKDPIVDSSPRPRQREADEPWTFVDSQADVEYARGKSVRNVLVAVPHERGLSGAGPGAVSGPVGPEGVYSPEPVRARMDEVHAIAVENARVTATEKTVTPAAVITQPKPPVVRAEPAPSFAAQSTPSPSTPASRVPSAPARASHVDLDEVRATKDANARVTAAEKTVAPAAIFYPTTLEHGTSAIAVEAAVAATQPTPPVVRAEPVPSVAAQPTPSLSTPAPERASRADLNEVRAATVANARVTATEKTIAPAAIVAQSKPPVVRAEPAPSLAIQPAPSPSTAAPRVPSAPELASRVDLDEVRAIQVANAPVTAAATMVVPAAIVHPTTLEHGTSAIAVAAGVAATQPTPPVVRAEPAPSLAVQSAPSSSTPAPRVPSAPSAPSPSNPAPRVPSAPERASRAEVSEVRAIEVANARVTTTEKTVAPAAIVHPTSQEVASAIAVAAGTITVAAVTIAVVGVTAPVVAATTAVVVATNWILLLW